MAHCTIDSQPARHIYAIAYTWQTGPPHSSSNLDMKRAPFSQAGRKEEGSNYIFRLNLVVVQEGRTALLHPVVVLSELHSRTCFRCENNEIS